VAQGGSGKGRTSGGKPAPAQRSASDARPAETATRRPQPPGRRSVAAARQTSPGSSRTQMIIGTIAVALIAIVVVVGLVLNKRQTSSPVTDHPVSTNSTASVRDGVITVSGGTSTLTIDVFEDGICPACQAFEQQYGQQMMKAVDDGKLNVRYHFLDFLNPNSPSKDYSTRAAAALECVAAVPAATAPKGLFLNFHTMMFTSGIQPAEGGSADLSNEQIAQIAVKAGAPTSAAGCISSGANITQAKATAEASERLLAQAVGGDDWRTPTALKDGAPLALNSTDWLTRLLS